MACQSNPQLFCMSPQHGLGEPRCGKRRGDKRYATAETRRAQDRIKDNSLGEGKVFACVDGGAGASFKPSDRPNEIMFTAPERPGKHTVTVASPAGECPVGENDANTAERCTARFTITVRRPSTVPEQRPAPRNPVREILSVLADAEGRQYDVFTPEQGGYFDSDEVTVSAEPGVVPNLEIIGVRAEASGSASNIGMTTQRYTLVGDRYDVLAVEASETAISSYVLNAPLDVCVPLPPAARHDVSDIALVADNPDGALTVLSASVRIATKGTNVCGNLCTIPATIAVGSAESPDAIPTPTPEPESTIPDTGGTTPSGNALLLFTIVGTAVTLGGVGLVSRRRRARQGIPAATISS